MAALYNWGKNKVEDAFGISPDYKMLLLGETGSGKTSFLNLLCNLSLIEKLGYTEGAKQLRNFNDIKLENSEASRMESKTGDAKLYCVKLFGLRAGVIDTPGFGDTRGTDVDEKHAKKIVDALKGEEYVNCVCLIINGRAARMSATLQYVLSEITAILPRVVLSNVIVVFTNTSDPLDLNFDTDQLRPFLGREIEEERLFLIENPYCRLEKAKTKAGKFSRDAIARSLKKAFDETREVLTGLSTAIKDFNRVHTHHFATLYETKQEVDRKVLALLTEYDNQTRLEGQIAIAEQEVNAALQTKKLNKTYRSTQEIRTWIQTPTSRHNTLCGASDCYSNCHFPCGLDMSYDKKAFLECGAMAGTSCKECGHHYTLHYHVKSFHELRVEQKEWVDDDMKRKFEEAKTMEERARIFREKRNQEREKAQQKRKELSERLLLTLEELHKLGATRNYAKVLENQLALVNQRLQGKIGPQTDDLRKAKEEMEKKLKLVREILHTPWEQHGDAAAQKDWACKMLGVSPSATKSEVEKAYHEAARSTHPDKLGGDEESFKRVGRARDILLK